MNKETRIGFSRTDGWISKAIRAITRSQWSHCWISYWDKTFDRRMLFESDFFGPDIVSTAKLKKYEYIEIVPPEKIDLDLSLKSLAPSLDMPYDYGSILGRLWVYGWRWLGKKVKNPFRSTRKDTCVESVFRLLALADFRFAGRDPEEESPGSLYRLLLSRGWTEVR